MAKGNGKVSSVIGLYLLRKDTFPGKGYRRPEGIESVNTSKWPSRFDLRVILIFKLRVSALRYEKLAKTSITRDSSKL